ncbi:4-(cytidine 5'-diphospho)-2-C-methyl-D-erythritol kinase [Sphingomonas sp. ASY06-1R]|uniref:4-(cytidine 5'-diphospho)-2-C-methyl-D-erythritol kinase n=1 Tax=Sphingomonas sp. ASY06-1R TaxID=3445771 RepID=UPI003FA2FBA5
MSSATETAFAKINLALHVRRRDPDGYHAIETLFAFAEDGDRLRLIDRPGLTISGPFAAGLEDSDNLVLKAARAFMALTGQGDGLGFALEKNLPVASGIGGGSADAAAALRLLCGRFGKNPADPAIQALAAGLGADVPACLLSQPVRGAGRGDRLTPVSDLPAGMPLLLVNPNQPLATGAVFAGWDGLDRGALGEGDPLALARGGRNDLEAPAVALMPPIAVILGRLREQAGALLVRMSGSGATCFALFDAAKSRDTAAQTIGERHPEWWQMSSRLR